MATNEAERLQSRGNRPPLRFAAGAVCALFLLGIIGPWWWYHGGAPRAGVRYGFLPKLHLSGYRFLPLPINAAARDELGTTNLINGVYSNATTTVIGFFADWPAELGRQMNVIQHTPDMCWVGAGAVAVEMNSPRTIDLEFEGVRLPFECRVFRLPGRLTLEAAMWCTLISGRVYEEQARVTAETGSESDSYQRSLAAHRRRGFGTFRQVLRDRIPGTSSKQFARFSTEIRGSTDAAFEDLKRFGQTWLKLQVEEGSPKAGGGQREWKALD